jgi:hypothetical protein
MNNFLAHWWKSYQFRSALKKGNTSLATQLLREIERSGVKLSYVEKLFQEQLRLKESLQDSEQELKVLRQKSQDLQNQQILLQETLQDSEQELKVLRKKSQDLQNQQILLQETLQNSEQELTVLRQKSQDLQNQQILLQETLQNSEQELTVLRQKSQDLQLELSKINKFLQPNSDFITYIRQSFKIIECDANMWQPMGINQTFENFEAMLADFIESEFKNFRKNNSEEYFKNELEKAKADIDLIKQRIDPKYSFKFTPHVYLIKYFLENVYTNYIAWLLIYEAGLLPVQLNILDIAAGHGTTAYGLALFLKDAEEFSSIDPVNISYLSLEKEKEFQYQGLQLWRKYIDNNSTGINAYFRWRNNDIFSYQSDSSNLPKNFYNLIVISHCFFNDQESRKKSQAIYKQIFTDCLTSNGYVLLIVQYNKLLKFYNNSNPVKTQTLEAEIISKFVQELGLKIVLYKYLQSTGQRTFLEKYKFAKFVQENLVSQKYMRKLAGDFKLYNHLHYTIDDYVILAQID